MSDQFEIANNSAYFGSMSEQVVTGTMTQGDNGQGTQILGPEDMMFWRKGRRDRVYRAILHACW